MFPLLEAVFERVLRLFSVLLLTDVVLAGRVLVLMYVYVTVCINAYIGALAISHLGLLTHKPAFQEGHTLKTPLSCAFIIVISDSYKQDMKGTMNRIVSLLFLIFLR